VGKGGEGGIKSPTLSIKCLVRGEERGEKKWPHERMTVELISTKGDLMYGRGIGDHKNSGGGGKAGNKR